MGPPLDEKRFFDSQTFSDITVVFDDGAQSRRCHKIIICSKSLYFMALCGPYSTAREIELKGDDPRAVQAMLRYMYTFDYGKKKRAGCTLNDDESDESDVSDEPDEIDDEEDIDGGDGDEDEDEGLGFHAAVYTVAVIYSLMELASQALSRFTSALRFCKDEVLAAVIETSLNSGEQWPDLLTEAIMKQHVARLAERQISESRV